jgi:hypothetical protein
MVATQSATLSLWAWDVSNPHIFESELHDPQTGECKVMVSFIPVDKKAMIATSFGVRQKFGEQQMPEPRSTIQFYHRAEIVENSH